MNSPLQGSLTTKTTQLGNSQKFLESESNGSNFSNESYESEKSHIGSINLYHSYNGTLILCIGF